MDRVEVSCSHNVVTRLRLFWQDSRSLKAYILGTAAIAVWLKVALAATHWRATGIWFLQLTAIRTERLP